MFAVPVLLDVQKLLLSESTTDARNQYFAIPGFIVAALARKYLQRLAINTRIGHDITGDLDQSEAAASIRCPALIVWGREDKVSHVSNAALLHRTLRDSQLEILDDVGHVPMVEAPQRVADLCGQFLGRVSAARSSYAALHQH